MEYFWYWRPQDHFPPPPITRVSEFGGGPRLNIACTQINVPAREQRKVLQEWCDELPVLTGLQFVWFSSRVPQSLFDAACSVPGLEGLYVKWSSIGDLAALTGASHLRYLHIGQPAKVSSIEPIAQCPQLRWLGLEMFSLIRDFQPLQSLIELEGLSLEGSFGAPWQVDTIAPLGALSGLRYLSIANLRSADCTLAGLYTLQRLETFRHANWWKASELSKIKGLNPSLEGA